MSRYDETKSALTEVLEGLGAEPRSLYDVGGIELIPGNRVRILPAPTIKARP